MSHNNVLPGAQTLFPRETGATSVPMQLALHHVSAFQYYDLGISIHFVVW